MQFGHRSASPIVRVAGPALVLVIGPGAVRAARRAFRAGEWAVDEAAARPRLAAGELVAVPLEDPDPDTVRELVGAAQHADRAVDAVVLGGVPAGLPRGRFRVLTELAGDAFTVDRLPAAYDRRDRTGPFDVIGDVHGCLEELLLLLARLGYEVRLDLHGRPVGAVHPAGRTVVLLGDLVDRGPDVPGVLRLVLGMLAAGEALVVIGNHDDKLRRALLGHDVERNGGLDASLAQLDREPEAFRTEVAEVLGALPDHLLLDGGRLVVAHAGIAERFQGHESARVRALCLYGPTTGATDENGLPDRVPWAEDYRGEALVAYGHTPTAARTWRNGTVCLDGGCVFGGSLVALRYPERTFAEVRSIMRHSEPARPFLPAG
ncbi:metallophosphoesterase [Amnibacterium sp.]|uniref:metallophosphoesterase n=1 Tax=Amnibacterium sp. TaxID=1872496 RepID=UPI003F7B9C5E